MKKFRLFLMVIFLITIQRTVATTYYSRVSGNWATNSTWSTVGYTSSTNTGSYPKAGDIVNVGNNFTVTIAAAAACSTLNIVSTLNIGGYNLTVSGATTISGTLNINAYNGTKIFTGLVTVKPGGTWNNAANSPVTFKGGITNNGTFTGTGNMYTFDTNPQSLTGTFDLTGTPITITGITLTNNGTITLSGNMSGTGTLANASVINSTSQITLAALTNSGIANVSDGNLTPTTLTNTGTLSISGSTYTQPATLTNSGIINYTASGNLGASSSFTNTGTINLNGSGYINSITNSTGGIVNLMSVGLGIGTLNNSASTSVLNVSALTTNESFINTLTASATGNIVNYNGIGSQVIKNTTYSYLDLNGSGTKSCVNSTTAANGNITINANNTLVLSNSNIIGNSSIILNGGTFNTGSSSGYTETVGTLTLSDNSTIALGTGSHSLTFANSSSTTWSGTLTITGWAGTAGSSGTAGKIYVGSATGLTPYQLSCITFSGYPSGASILSTGEVVPTSSALAFWYKGDGTYSGGTWTDVSGKGNNATTVSETRTNGTIALTNNSINFNPSLSFSNVVYKLKTASSASIQSVIIVNQPTTSTAANGGLFGYCDYSSGSNEIGIRMNFTNQDWTGENNANDWAYSGSGYYGSSRINGASGSVHNFKWNIINQVTSTAKNYRYYIGGYFDVNWGSTWHPRPFYGNVAEVMAFSGIVPNQNNIESYLAVKYGITLSHDYTNGSGSTVYAISGYGYDVAGLGKDATYGLDQKVSTSINVSPGSAARVIMATTNDYSSSNLASSRTTLTNGQYLVWGHNNGTVATWNTVSGASYKKINRVWRIQNTGGVGAVSMQIDLTGFASLPSGCFYSVLVGNETFTTNAGTYKLTNSSGTLYYANITFPAGTNYFTIICTPKNYWMGSSSNTNWSTATNWTAGLIPGTNDEVEFATTSNYGTNAVSDLTCDGDYTINNLTNASSKNLIIPTGKSLKVNGTITIPTGTNRIYIQSSSTTPNGTLIFNNPASNPVNGTVEIYSKASWDLSATTNNKYKWQYFGIPVASVVASPTFDGSYVRQMDESGTTTSNHWIQMNNSSALSAFTGYEICQSQPTTYAVSGQLVNSNLVTGPISYTNGAIYPGQHLYGNPYTAAIDITKISFGTGVDSTIYLYNTGTFVAWGAYSSNGSSPGQYTAVPQLTAGVGGIPSQIPSTQGFLIKTKTSDVSNATMTINYNTAVVKNTELKRAPSASKTASRLPYLKIFVQGQDNTSDVMWMIHQESCTPHFDNGWDGYKMYGNDYSPQIFANENTDYYQVNSVGNFDQTYIGFKAGADSVYTLQITKDGIDDIYSSLQLIDLKENKPTPIGNDTIEYKFKASPGELTDKRFIISGELKKTPTISGIKVYSFGNTLFINNYTGENGNMQLYDLTGRKLSEKRFAPETTPIPTNLPEGIYIVKASAGNVSKSFRLFLKKE